jgi:hypothetical protein
MLSNVPAAGKDLLHPSTIKVYRSLDGQVTPWDGLTFAFLGEISQGMVTTMEFATAF